MDWIRDEGRTTPAWRRYAAALLLVLRAALVSVTLRQWLTAAPLAPFFAAVALAAWYGGSGPVITAVALSLAPISLVALEPVWVWSLTSPDQRALLIFALVSGLLVLLSASRDRTERELGASGGSAASSKPPTKGSGWSTAHPVPSTPTRAWQRCSERRSIASAPAPSSTSSSRRMSLMPSGTSKRVSGERPRSSTSASAGPMARRCSS